MYFFLRRAMCNRFSISSRSTFTGRRTRKKLHFEFNLLYKKKKIEFKNFISLMFYLFSQIDEAGQEKYRLEEKQRASRRKREGKKETWEPR